MARVKQDVIEDETLESHVGKVTIDVNHILDRLVELDVRVAHVHQCSSPAVIVLTFEVLHVLREPQRQSVIPFVLCNILIHYEWHFVLESIYFRESYAKDAKIHVASSGRVDRRCLTANNLKIIVPNCN